MDETDRLAAAIVRTVAYSDVFNYPLTAVQIHRYLEGLAAPLADVERVLAHGRLLPQNLSRRGNFFMLAGREEIAAVRQEREIISHWLWPRAARYGRLIALLPFVRMAAVTGSLTMNNADAEADTDYLIVTKKGRVWLTRALIILVVRLARRGGIDLCPNYILAENALAFSDRNLYVAHEVAQMVPLSGMDVYWRLRRVNEWTAAFLPNAAGPSRKIPQAYPGFWQKAAELPLRTAVGGWLERWEMERKIRNFNAQETAVSETSFSPDYCKGHFEAYNRPTMSAYQLTIDNCQLPIGN
ncbi:MAG: hypothetical protein ACE5FD_03055 [Anaerolineae bacterium]